jgi:hypothetical protein
LLRGAAPLAVLLVYHFLLGCRLAKKKCTVVLAIPKEGKLITIGLAHRGDSTAWFSNFFLAEVDSNTKTTELPMDESKFPMDNEPEKQK